MRPAAPENEGAAAAGKAAGGNAQGGKRRLHRRRVCETWAAQVRGTKTVKKNDMEFGWLPSRIRDNPDVLFGRDFEDDPPLKIEGERRGNRARQDPGQVTAGSQAAENHHYLPYYGFTDTITVNVLPMKTYLRILMQPLSRGTFIRVCGMTTIDKFDGELTLGSVRGDQKRQMILPASAWIQPGKAGGAALPYQDERYGRRVRGKGSIIKGQAVGHAGPGGYGPWLCQAFTEANHALDRGPFKILYGVEGYLVDDTKHLVENSEGPEFGDTFVVFDIETTGFSPKKNKIIEIGAVKVVDGQDYG